MTRGAWATFGKRWNPYDQPAASGPAHSLRRMLASATRVSVDVLGLTNVVGIYS
jgi:hypothetical protein